MEDDMWRLKIKLWQTNEEIQMTKEDLTTKLIQRAEAVAEWEELDEAMTELESQFQMSKSDFTKYMWDDNQDMVEWNVQI